MAYCKLHENIARIKLKTYINKEKPNNNLFGFLLLTNVQIPSKLNYVTLVTKHDINHMILEHHPLILRMYNNILTYMFL